MDGNIPSLMELLVNYLAIRNVERPDEEIGSPDEEIGSPDEEVEGNNSPVVIWPREPKDCDHLLHLYYRCYIKTPRTDLTGGSICGTILNPSRITTLLLSYIRSKICRSNKKTLPRTIPSATELLEAGVKIKKKKKTNQNRLSCFLDVTFSDGVLEIPFLSVDNSTLSRFTNLTAFEQCGRCKPEKAYVTSYATFMDCLIDTPRDVAILHQSGVLENQLASDNELAVFFNQLSDCAVMDYNKHYLAELFQEVGEYCDSDWHKWKAKLIRDYFTYPWPILSLSAAAVILISTLVQAFFAVYSFYHPRN